MKKHLRQLFTNKYGKTPDLNVLNRFKSELKLFEAIRESNDIIKASIDIHNIAYSDRYFFFGSNSASWLISNLLGITKSNPLPAHYHCDSCKRIFWSNVQYSFDLPAQICTCGNLLHSEGYNYNLYNQFFYRKNFTMLFTDQMPLAEFPWSTLPFKKQLDLFAFYHNSHNNRLEKLTFDDCIQQCKSRPFHFMYTDDIEAHLIKNGRSQQFAVLDAQRISRGLLREYTDFKIKLSSQNYFTHEQLDELINIRYLFPRAHAVEFLLSVQEMNNKKKG